MAVEATYAEYCVCVSSGYIVANFTTTTLLTEAVVGITLKGISVGHIPAEAIIEELKADLQKVWFCREENGT